MNMMSPHAQSIWNAFAAGMQMLQKYAYRSTIELDASAAANIRLLHKTLLKDSVYKSLLVQAVAKDNASLLPTFHCLVKSTQLQARLINLGSTSPHTLSTRTGELASFYLIRGKIEQRTDISEMKSAALQRSSCKDIQQQINKVASSKCYQYKAGDAWVSQQHRDSTMIITAKEGPCLLLDIRLPSQTETSNNLIDKLAS
jgi:hypothetical protein